MGEQLAILDAGAQYGKVIDRRVRELKVESHLLPMNTPAEQLKGYQAIIISGGPESVYDENAPEYDPEIFSLGLPIFGICYGMQLMNHVAGGAVQKKELREDGQHRIQVNPESSVFKGLNKEQRVLLSHGDSVDTLAEGFQVTARSEGLVSAIENPTLKQYGVQFHPEVDLTEHGREIIHNFLYEVAGFTGDYTMEDREEKAISYIQETAGEREVLLLVSGGVDSTVCAALLNKALGSERVHALHVDNGYMRLDESRKVKKALEDVGLELEVADAKETFYASTTTVNGETVGPLAETTSPEHKRHIIGDAFMTVSEKAIQELVEKEGLEPDDIYLAQGTLRPDLIESASKIASGKASTIKTHHNDTALVRALREKRRIIEPLAEYHKDEVRELGRMLGLPEEIVMRQPFPGPGLAVRILCAEESYITEDFERINEQLQEFSTSDISATLLPVRTVGVQGDGRSYSYLAGLSGKRDWEELFKTTQAITDNIHKINRAAYIFGEKIKGPVTGITPTHPNPEAVKQLQIADEAVNQVMLKHGLIQTLSQVPVISFPVHFGQPGNRSIAIRTFITNDFMTGRPAMPGEDLPEEALDEMVEKVLKKTPNISRVAYDLTSKPPGTTEWE